MNIDLSFTDPELERDPKAREWLRHCNHILNSNKQLKTDIEKARLDIALYGTATVNIEEKE